MGKLVTQLASGVSCFGLERELEVRAPTGLWGGLYPILGNLCSQVVPYFSEHPEPQPRGWGSLPRTLSYQTVLLLQSFSQKPSGPNILGTSHSMYPHWTLPHGSHLRTDPSTTLGTPSPKLGSQIQSQPSLSPL